MAKISELIFDPNMYMHKYDQMTLDKAVSCINSGIPCPPIDVDANMRIIGGHKQWIASWRAKKSAIPARIHDLIKSNTDALMFACKQNSNILTENERNSAIALILDSIEDTSLRPAIKETLAEIFGTSLLEINKAKINVEKKTESNSRIASLYLSGYSITQISREISTSKYLVIKALTQEGLYTSQYKLTSPAQDDIDEFVGNSLDNAISRKDDIESLLEMMEGTCASLTEEYNRYGMTLDNYKNNIKSTRDQVNKITKTLDMLMEQVRSTMPVLKDPQMINDLLLEINPLIKKTKDFIRIIDQYKDESSHSSTPISLMRNHYLKLIENTSVIRSCNQ